MFGKKNGVKSRVMKSNIKSSKDNKLKQYLMLNGPPNKPILRLKPGVESCKMVSGSICKHC